MESQSLLSVSGDVSVRQAVQMGQMGLGNLPQRLAEGGNGAVPNQGRLQGLPDNIQEVASRTDLDGVLQQLEQLVDAARRLVGADYATIGVLSRGQLVRFVPPTKRAGWPVEHPPTRPMLTIPIVARGEVFGILYLADKPGGVEFSTKDQKLGEALASAAGMAIGNVELVDELRRRQAWQSAMTQLTTLLLSGADPQVALPVLAGQARRLSGVDTVAVAVPTDDPARLRVAVGTGLLHPRRVGETIPVERSISQLIQPGRTAIVVDQAAADPRTAAVSVCAPGIGPLVAAPLVAALQGVESGQGVLLVARTTEEPPFRPPDAEMIVDFAAHAGRVLVLADARRKRELVRLVEDRERIAQQLSEQAMQALLGITTTVHGLAARMQARDDAHRLGEQVDRLDAVLREMRRAIFGLQLPGQFPGPDRLARPEPWADAAGA